MRARGEGRGGDEMVCVRGVREGVGVENCSLSLGLISLS